MVDGVGGERNPADVAAEPVWTSGGGARGGGANAVSDKWVTPGNDKKSIRVGAGERKEDARECGRAVCDVGGHVARAMNLRVYIRRRQGGWSPAVLLLGSSGWRYGH